MYILGIHYNVNNVMVCTNTIEHTVYYVNHYNSYVHNYVDLCV